MAKRKQPAKADVEAEIAVANGAAAGGASDAHVVVFRLADQRLGFALADVAEILRPPALAKMPLGPKSLLGLANLRGVVLPVVGLRRLLGLGDAPSGDTTRVIVIDRGAPVGFLVDGIDRLLTATANSVQKDSAGAGGIDPDLLDGIIKGAEGDDSIKILNPVRLLRDEFARLAAAPRAPGRVSISAAAVHTAAAEPQQQLALVSFELGAQEYALPLDRVREIISLPEHVSRVPRPETAVLGVVTLRDRLLPLVSLRALLGLPEAPASHDGGKVLVVSMGHGAVGVVADRTREILRVDARLIDPAPALLTRGAGEAEIASICRLDHGKRLVAVLSPDRLFRSELVKRVLSEQTADGDTSDPQTDAMADEQFIVFRLGDQEYGVPIEAVDEVARPPKLITKLPKAPAFIEGVMNLRGGVVPIVDLRRRFELPPKEPQATRRILVVAIGGSKTGFMVDGVSEILKLSSDAISPAPDVSSDEMRLIGRVANLEAQGRMILLIDPTQLLDRVEADVLAKFERTAPVQTSKAS
jgi:purine-binding chemotaxis protein CheW